MRGGRLLPTDVALDVQPCWSCGRLTFLAELPSESGGWNSRRYKLLDASPTSTASGFALTRGGHITPRMLPTRATPAYRLHFAEGCWRLSAEDKKLATAPVCNLD